MKLGSNIMNMSPNKTPCSDIKEYTLPKKFKVSQSAGKLMATVFWDLEGILLIKYKDKGVSITKEYNASILEQLKEPIKEKRRGK